MNEQASPYRLPAPAGFFTEPTCWHWCHGSYEHHERARCYRAHAAVASSVERPHRVDGAAAPRDVRVCLEVTAGGRPLVAVLVGARTDQQRRLSPDEARALAACLLDAADVADVDSTGESAGRTSMNDDHGKSRYDHGKSRWFGSVVIPGDVLTIASRADLLSLLDRHYDTRRGDGRQWVSLYTVAAASGTANIEIVPKPGVATELRLIDETAAKRRRYLGE